MEKAVVHLSGDISVKNNFRIKKDSIYDLSKVTSIDSFALSEFVTNRHSVKIRHASPKVKEIMTLLGADRVLPIEHP